MPISTKIQETSDLIVAERVARQTNPNAPAPVSKAVEDGAIGAIFGGRQSQAWKDYMERFSSSTAEMERLVPTQPDLDATREKARAYLVRNGVCGMLTGEDLSDNVGTRLDL